jgi:hypothetical protein
MSEEGGPACSRSRSPCEYEEIDSCEDDFATASQPTIENLTNQNARLLQENMTLRKQYLQINEAAQFETTEGKASPTYCETQEMPPTEQTQESRWSVHSHAETLQQSNCIPSGSPMACTTMPGGLPTMVAPAAEVIEHPRSDGVFPNMLVGSFVWVPMESSMPLDPQVFPMASFANTQPFQQEPGLRSRRGVRPARTKHTPLTHAAVVDSKKMPKVQNSLVFRDIQNWGEQHDCDLSQLHTTVMLRNLPNNYSPTMLLDLIDSEGFETLYDFFYLPIDFTSKASLGYAFVNLTSHEAAKRFCNTFDGFSNWSLPSRKICWVSWSGPHQGLDAHIERYRNSPLMHETIPDIYKPALFKDGQRVTFPPPTKRLRAPRIKRVGFRNAGPPGVLLDPKVQPQLAFQQLQEIDEPSGDEQRWS